MAMPFLPDQPQTQVGSPSQNAVPQHCGCDSLAACGVAASQRVNAAPRRRRHSPSRAIFSLNLRFFAGLAVAFAAFTSITFGCSVPVFRYALDRWPADMFRLEAPPAVFQTEPLATELRGLGQVSPLNLDAVRIADAPPDSTARLTFPARDGDEPATAWSGVLSPSTFKTLVDSAGRKEVARRILAGDSAVWVLVESGKREADAAAAELLTKRLGLIESAAELPPIDPNDPSSRLGPGPALQAKLSLQRIRREDPAEAAFIAMLAGPEGLGALPKDEPFAALVFGRGRVLGAWPAEKLSADLIEEASLFLFGACSCEIKNLNPGWDLLLNVDWDTELEKTEQVRVTAAGGSDAETATEPVEKPNVSLKPETVTMSAPAALAAPAPGKTDKFPRWPLYGAGAALLFATALLGKRRKTP